MTEAEPRITSLSTDDRAWLAARFHEAGQLVLRYNGPDAPATFHDLDDVLEHWTRSTERDREEPEFVVQALGTALGGHLCDRWGFDWCVVTDEYGIDYAVRGQPNDVLIGPLNATAKRVAAGAERFFEQFARDAEVSMRPRPPPTTRSTLQAPCRSVRQVPVQRRMALSRCHLQEEPPLVEIRRVLIPSDFQ